MEMLMHHPKMWFLLCLLLHSIYFATSQPYIGENLGTLSCNFPDKQQLAKFLNLTYIRKVRMFHVDQYIIMPMADIDVTMIVNTPNNADIHSLATIPGACDRWINAGIRRYNLFKQVHMIIVGDQDAIDKLLPTLQNTQTSVDKETGWPSNGDDNENGATMKNARLYNASLIHHLRSMVGTPLMPKKTVDTYTYSLFDEDFIDGPTSKRSFGIAHYDLTWKYDLYLSKKR